jgi:hypothetical protein
MLIILAITGKVKGIPDLTIIDCSMGGAAKGGT